MMDVFSGFIVSEASDGDHLIQRKHKSEIGLYLEIYKLL